MRHIKRFLPFTLVLFLAVGISACSKDKQPEVQPERSSDAETISVTMYKNPDCQCCSKWAAYLEENGFSVTQKPTDALSDVKQQQGVPDQLGACHTALIEGYVVEGHVPVEAIHKLLQEKPDTKGIAVPGMPAGAPGTQGERSPVDVYFFKGPDQVAFYDKF